MSKQIAVLISDIHFNINTLKIASKALRSAVNKAEELKLPLIIAGDLNDTKAIIRAEVANELIDIFSNARASVYILVGNHDRINEHHFEHGLNFLRPYTRVIDQPTFEMIEGKQLLLIPYQSDAVYLQHSKKMHDIIIVMHQGVHGAWMGDYVQDKTSIEPNFKSPVISGHYHKHQTVNSVTYIGSPYTISFGEAHDGPKGFLILKDDGSFTREILSLRKHVIEEFNIEELNKIPPGLIMHNPEDLVWLKVRGSFSELQKLDKKKIGMNLLGHTNYKLDLITLDSEHKVSDIETMNEMEVLDSLIDNLNDTSDQKKYLKELAREIIES